MNLQWLKKIKRPNKIVFFVLCFLAIFAAPSILAAAKVWDFTSSSDYLFDNSKIEFSAGQAQLKASSSWYNVAWTKRQLITIDNSANAATLSNYQVKVDVTYDSEMQSDFDDIRFTTSDGITLTDHWLETKTDSTNATFWVEVPSITASATTPMYMYYGNAGVSTTSSGSKTFPQFDDFNDNSLVAPLEVFSHEAPDLTTGLAECAVFANNKVYVGKQSGGFFIFDIPTGNILGNYLTSTSFNASPIFDSNGDIHMYAVISEALYKVRESDGVVLNTLTVDPIDIESMGWDEENQRIIIPRTTGAKAYNLSDYSEAWSASYTNGGSQASPLVVGNFVYVRARGSGGFMYKLNKSNGAIVATSPALGDQDALTYSSPIYDPDHDYIYVIGGQGQVHALSAADLSLVWSKTIGAGMLNPRQQYSPAYHSNQLYVALRDDSTAGGDLSKIYALDSADGDLLWTNSYPFDHYMSVSNFVVTDTHVIASGIDSGEDSAYLIRGGELVFINVADGSTSYVTPLRKGATSCSLSNAYAGQLAVSEHLGRFQLLDLGSGSSTDSLHWKGNVYHNGYVGDHLIVDTSLLSSLNQNIAWATAGTPSISGGVLTVNSAGTYLQGNLSRSNVTMRTKAKAYTPTGGNAGFGLMQNPKVGGDSVISFFNSITNGDLRTLTQVFGYTLTDLDAAYTDAFYTFEARWQPGEVKTYIDNVLKNTHTTDVSTRRLPLAIATYGTTRVDVDWILMRNYSSPEPSVSLGLEDGSIYPTDAPAITASSAQAFTSLSGFSATETLNGGTIKYQVSSDGGTNWYWYNSGWEVTSSGYAEANTSSEIQSAISSLPQGTNSLVFRAYLSSDGSQLVQLDSIDLTYENETPTPTPSPTPGTSSSTASNQTSSPSSPSAPVCNAQPPGSKAPWLYGAIPQSAESVLLYFTEAGDPLDTYALEFGTESGKYTFGATNIGGKGTRTYLVQLLAPNTTYYFRVRGGNGCAPGEWSNELSIKTNPLISLHTVHIVRSELDEGETIPSLSVNSGMPSPENEGYSVNIKVVDKEQRPVGGAKVTIHSKVQETITDENGIARFGGVERGDHKVLIAFNGHEGEQSLNLTGDKQEVSLTITVETKNILLDSRVLIGAGLLLATILILSILLIRSRAREKKFN